MEILLIRHADPDYEADGLTPLGHLQARALARRLAASGIDELHASPLGRAQQTAGYIAEATGLPIVTEPWTRELEGWRVRTAAGLSKHAWDFPAEEIPDLRERRERWSREEDHWLRDPDKAAKFAELAEHSDRCLAGFGYVREGGIYRCSHEREERLRVALVCHGGFGLTWLAHVLQLPLSHAWAGFWLAPSSVTTLLWERREPSIAVPRCLGLSDLSHLYADSVDLLHR